MQEITLKRFSEINAQINSTEDLHDLLILIMDTAKEMLKTEGASLLLYDEKKEELYFDIVRGTKGNLLANQRIGLGVGIAGLVAQSHKPIIVNDAADDTRVFKTFDEENKFTTRNLIAVPLKTSEKLIGVLEVVNSLDRRAFDSMDEQLLVYFSDQAAIAIYNRRLFQDLKIRMDELACIYEISKALSHSYDFLNSFDHILQAISDNLNAEKVSFILGDGSGGDYHLIAAVGLDFQQIEQVQHSLEKQHSLHGQFHKETRIEVSEGSVLAHVLRAGDPILHQESRSPEVDYSFSSRGSYRTGSFVSIPITYKNKIMGALNVADKKNGQDFDLFDFRVLSTIGRQISTAYNNYRIQQENINVEQLRKDLEMASLIQQNSLPQLPKHYNGMDIAYYYKACESVGGDFYDMVILGDNIISFVIGDVSGKGISAALFMEHVKTLLQGLIPRFKNPRTTVSELNKKILSENRHTMFATVMAVQIEQDEHLIRFASAGHNRQYLVQADDATIVSLSGKGVPAGTFRSDRYTESLRDYNPGDYLFLYTDGITEAINDDMEEYGEGRLKKAIIECLHAEKNVHPQRLLDLILIDLQQFIGDTPLQDDLTALVVKL